MFHFSDLFNFRFIILRMHSVVLVFTSSITIRRIYVALKLIEFHIERYPNYVPTIDQFAINGDTKLIIFANSKTFYTYKEVRNKE